MKILIINGPNINFLGIREKSIYGNVNYKDMCNILYKEADLIGVELKIVQSNIEGEIINFIQDAYEKYDGIVINAGAYTHYSIAIFDAIKSVNIPTVEVHLSNIYSREEFRHKSVISAACIGQICGFGINSYTLAMQGLIQYLRINIE